MRELGGEEEKAHIELAKFLSNYSSPLFLVGNAMNTTMKKYFEMHGSGALQEIYYFNTYVALGEALKNYIIHHSSQPYLVLFK
jgi:UDP-N-acetylmuramyl pentapeptide synthase